ncbi:hypothetical protein KIN20_013168 [Parelaphostrongylus tenuis]|uniref:Uncharacterized protein n=1 Tax=Parelaphostrongylus tenuis TaxID=148309 RepID=A0AAD5QNB4_PARTN|nr:hypothetical protein KIN20_013168 [Parelaphostrongylus tenuis]
MLVEILIYNHFTHLPNSHVDRFVDPPALLFQNGHVLVMETRTLCLVIRKQSAGSMRSQILSGIHRENALEDVLIGLLRDR